MRAIPDAKLKNLHQRKGGGCLGRYIKIYRALGTLYAKLTSNRIAANGRFKLNGVNSAEILNRIKQYHVAV